MTDLHDMGVSSMRVKRNIQTVEKSTILDDIKELRIVDFTYINDATPRRGLISEELFNIPSFTDCVHTADELVLHDIEDDTEKKFANVKCINYERLTITLMIALKDLVHYVEEKNNKIMQLEQDVSILKSLSVE
jgi:hypothetical protein